MVFLTAPSPDKAVEASIEVMMHVDLESSLPAMACDESILESEKREIGIDAFIHSPLASRAPLYVGTFEPICARRLRGCANHSFSRFLVPVPCLTIMTSNRPQITPSETI